MSISEFVALVASLVAIGTGIAISIRYLRRPERDWKLMSGVFGGVLVVLLIAVFVSRTTTIVVNGQTTLFGSSGTMASPSATSVPVPTTTPTPFPTATALPTATPRTPPYVLCQSGAKDNWTGWSLGGAWSVLNGQMLNNGSGGGSQLPLMAPVSCQPPTPDYLVEARMELVADAYQCCGAYGIDVRANTTSNGLVGYTGFNSPCTLCSGVGLAYIGGDIRNQPQASAPDPGTGWHTYGVEVNGNTVTLLIDRSPVVHFTDNMYLEPGSVGIWSEEQIVVSSFQVTILP